MIKSKRYLGRDNFSPIIEVQSSHGNYIYDPSGKKYLDFSVGWCGSLGWGLPEIKNAISSFDGPAYVDPYYSYQPWEELAKMLIKMAPGNMGKAFRALGGTEAVEIALQAAMHYTGRTKIISAEDYHGHSIATLGIGFSHYRSVYPGLPGVNLKINYPHDKSEARRIEKILRQKETAAVILEPINLNGGVLIPTQEFFDILQTACRETGTVFIVDEVATGFGRTGKLFGSSHFNLKPDIICLGKGLTGGYAALGATLMTKELAKSMAFEFSSYSTFGWHPLNVHITINYLKCFFFQKKEILVNVGRNSTYVRKCLSEMKFKYQPQIRSQGMAIAVEFQEEGYVKKIVAKALKKGLLLSDLGPFTFGIFPPLTINKKEVEIGLKILESCI